MNIKRYGVGLLGDLADISESDVERLAQNNWHVRGTVDLKTGAARYEQVMRRLRDRGVTILPVLFWTGSDGKPCAPGHPEWDGAKWVDECNMLGDIFGAMGVQQVEIWNEQNSKVFWPAGERSADSYLEWMLGPVAESFPLSITIVCGGLQFRGQEGKAQRAEDWLAVFVRLGGHRLVDRWSIHPYGLTNDLGMRIADRNISADKAVEEIRRFKRKLNRLAETRPGVRKPIWVTETGLSTRRAEFTERDQRAFLHRVVTIVKKRGGYGVALWSNWPLRDPFPESSALYYSGLYRPGLDFEGTSARIKPAGEYWIEKGAGT